MTSLRRAFVWFVVGLLVLMLVATLLLDGLA
jgi:Ca2+/Na+ antiporter